MDVPRILRALAIAGLLVAPSGVAAAANQSVSISGFAFSPAEVTVTPGSTVTWTNMDPAVHTVTADGGAFDSGDIASGGTFAHTFGSAGDFAYHCERHSSMTGVVRSGSGWPWAS